MVLEGERWAAQADYDLSVAELLYQQEVYRYCVFFCHLALEKRLGVRMAKVNDRVIRSRDGVVEIEVKHGFVIAHPKTDEQVRDIILEYVNTLQEYIVVDKAILVGSYARGCPREWDEIDVIIISSDFKSVDNGYRRNDLLIDKAVKVHEWLLPRGGYTPDEYAHHADELGLARYKAFGKVIYERDAG